MMPTMMLRRRFSAADLDEVRKWELRMQRNTSAGSEDDSGIEDSSSFDVAGHGVAKSLLDFGDSDSFGEGDAATIVQLAESLSLVSEGRMCARMYSRTSRE